MPKFRKKPVEIEASQWFKNGDHPKDGTDRMQPDFSECEGAVVRYFRRPDVPGTTPCRHCDKTMHDHGWIDTLEGGHIVCPGDYVITGVKGENYPCKPDIFAATYDEVIEQKKNLTIGELEQILREPDRKVHINPDGSVSAEIN